MPEKDDISFRFDSERNFNFRVGAFIHCENKILLHRPSSTKFWNLVGGRVKFQESTLQAIKRELKEELGHEFDAFVLRRVHENFFVWQGHKATELLFVYDLEINSNHPLFKKEQFELDDTEFAWFETDQVTQEKLFCLPKQIYEMALEKDWKFIHSEKWEYERRK